ncbi:MAG: HDOD domain-containing protein [Desulfomicrobium sp.]
MKPSILFVDDEQQILDSLRLSLRKLRPEWDMTFVTQGREALELFDIKPHDVVVTDLRMPEIDGATLLREIRRKNPTTARIILSGYSDHEAALKNICLANEYLCKPCSTQDLTLAIRRALDLREFIKNSKLKEVIAKIDNIPALPNSYIELNEALLDRNVSTKKIGEIIRKEMALVATILRIANSPFFGFQSKISNINQAITFLGIQTLRTLIISTHLFSSLKNSYNSSFSVNMLWEHSIRVAGFAKKIADAERLDSSARDDCIISGMLHDIGKLVLDTKFPEKSYLVIDKVNKEDCPLHEAEKNILGVTHAEIGAYLLGQWGFTHEQMEAVRWHQVMKPEYGMSMTPPLILHVANFLDHELVRIHSNHAPRSLQIGNLIPPDLDVQIAKWRDLCQSELEQGGFVSNDI